MNPNPADLTRQDEDISAAGFDAEETRDHHDFGNWPEAAGFVATAFVVWLIFAYTG